MTYGTLATVYGIGSVDVVKIDAEGFDHVILRQVYAIMLYCTILYYNVI